MGDPFAAHCFGRAFHPSVVRACAKSEGRFSAMATQAVLRH